MTYLVNNLMIKKKIEIIHKTFQLKINATPMYYFVSLDLMLELIYWSIIKLLLVGFLRYFNL